MEKSHNNVGRKADPSAAQSHHTLRGLGTERKGVEAAPGRVTGAVASGSSLDSWGRCQTHWLEAKNGSENLASAKTSELTEVGQRFKTEGTVRV